MRFSDDIYLWFFFLIEADVIAVGTAEVVGTAEAADMAAGTAEVAGTVEAGDTAAGTVPLAFLRPFVATVSARVGSATR